MKRCAHRLVAQNFAGKKYCVICGEYGDGSGNRYGGEFLE